MTDLVSELRAIRLNGMPLIACEEAADEIERLRAQIWNYEHGTAGQCAEAAIGAAKEWEAEVERLRAALEEVVRQFRIGDDMAGAVASARAALAKEQK